MDRWDRRADRGRRGLLVRLGLGLAILLLPATFPLTAASFTGSTVDDGNSVWTAAVQPPSGLAVTQTCGAGPGITSTGATSAGGGGLADTLTLTRPAGTVAGDFLVAQVANRQLAYTVNAPGGWTLLRRESGGSTVGTMVVSAVYWRWAAAGDPATWTWTLSGSPGVQMVGGIAAFSGVHPTTPTNTSGFAAGYSVTANTPSVTTTVEKTMLVHLLAKREENLPAPAGTTAAWSQISGAAPTNLGAAAGYELFGGPGATPSRASTLSGNTTVSMEWVAHTVALTPAPGPPSAGLTWTVSPSSWATGYRLERVVGGAVQNTAVITPISAASSTEGPLVNGTDYTYRLWAYSGTWASPAVTATLTPSC